MIERKYNRSQTAKNRKSSRDLSGGQLEKRNERLQKNQLKLQQEFERKRKEQEALEKAKSE